MVKTDPVAPSGVKPTMMAHTDKAETGLKAYFGELGPGWMGVAGTTASLLVAATLFAMGVNGIQLYTFSGDRTTWEARIIRSWTDANASSCAAGLPSFGGSPSPPPCFDVSVPINRESPGTENQILDANNWVMSDNYVWARLAAAYQHDNVEVIIGSIILVILAGLTLEMAIAVSFGWRLFFYKDLHSQELKANHIEATPAAKHARSRLRKLLLPLRQCFSAFMNVDEDAWENILLAIAFSASAVIGLIAGAAMSPTAFVSFSASALVLLLHELSVFSPLFRLGVMESVEVFVQVHQLLRFTGIDILEAIALGSDSADYLEVQVAAALPGPEGRTVAVLLLWLIALNCFVTPCLVAYRGAFSLSVAFFDLGLDLCYGVLALVAAGVASSQQTHGADNFVDSPPLIMMPYDITSLLLNIFPFALLRLHLPVNITAAFHDMLGEREEAHATATAGADEAGDEPTYSKPRPRSRRCLIAFAAIATVVSIGGASTLTALIMGAESSDSRCETVQALCQSVAFPTSFVDEADFTDPRYYGWGFVPLDLARQARLTNQGGRADMRDMTLFGFDGACYCTLPTFASFNYNPPSTTNCPAIARRQLAGASTSRRRLSHQTWSGAPAWCEFAGETLGRFFGLQELDLSRGKLTELPGEIGRLKLLTSIETIGNDLLANLPTEVGTLPNLKTIILYNHFVMTTLPTEIGNLASLEKLTIVNVGGCANTPSALQYLIPYGLGCDYGGSFSLPTEVGNLRSLRLLGIRTNPTWFTTLPTEVGNLANLERLLLQQNNLTSIPTEIGNLANLNELNFANNHISSVPDEIGNLGRLEELLVARNPLHSLPASFANLNLTDFFMGCTDIATLAAFPNLMDTTTYMHDSAVCQTSPRTLPGAGFSPAASDLPAGAASGGRFCCAAIETLGDGFCNPEANNAACNFDNGDCLNNAPNATNYVFTASGWATLQLVVPTGGQTFADLFCCGILPCNFTTPIVPDSAAIFNVADALGSSAALLQIGGLITPAP